MKKLIFFALIVFACVSLQSAKKSAKKAIPEIDWTKGHSGELLSEEVIEKLSEMRDEG